MYPGGWSRYLGSFWDQPLRNPEQLDLFVAEEKDLYTAVSQLHCSAVPEAAHGRGATEMEVLLFRDQGVLRRNISLTR